MLVWFSFSRDNRLNLPCAGRPRGCGQEAGRGRLVHGEQETREEIVQDGGRVRGRTEQSEEGSRELAV